MPVASIRCWTGPCDPIERPIATRKQAERNKRECPVANIKSQKKRNITNAKAHERNKAVRSELKSRIKSAVNTGDEAAVRDAIKRIDTAAQKGVIHKNAAARKKSRLMKKVAAGA